MDLHHRWILMYVYGEGLVSCKNVFPIQLYIYIDNKIIIRVIFKKMKTLCDIEGEISNWTN